MESEQPAALTVFCMITDQTHQLRILGNRQDADAVHRSDVSALQGLLHTMQVSTTPLNWLLGVVISVTDPQHARVRHADHACDCCACALQDVQPAC